MVNFGREGDRCYLYIIFLVLIFIFIVRSGRILVLGDEIDGDSFGY